MAIPIEGEPSCWEVLGLVTVDACAASDRRTTSSQHALENKKKAAFDVTKPQPQPLNDVTTTSPDVTTTSLGVTTASLDVTTKSHDVTSTSQNPPTAKKVRHLNLPKVRSSQP